MSDRTILSLLAIIAGCLLIVNGAPSPFEKPEGMPVEGSPDLQRPRMAAGMGGSLFGSNNGFMEEKIPGVMPMPNGPAPFDGPNPFGPSRPRNYRRFLRQLRRRLRRAREMEPELPVMTEIVIIRKIPILLSKLIIHATADKDKKPVLDKPGMEDGQEKIDPVVKNYDPKGDSKKIQENNKDDDEDDSDESEKVEKKGMKGETEELELQRDDPKSKGQTDNPKMKLNEKDIQMEQAKFRQQARSGNDSEGAKNDNSENDL